MNSISDIDYDYHVANSRIQSLEYQVEQLQQRLTRKGAKRFRTILILMLLNVWDEILGLIAVYFVFLK